MYIKKKNNALILFLSIFFLILISLINLNFSLIKNQIFSTSEWILSGDNGFSSFFNIIDDGSINYRGNYTQPISSKLLSLITSTPSIIKHKLANESSNQINTIYLDVKFKNFEKLLNDRKAAIEANHAISIDFTEVKADLTINGITKKTKISLKGLLNTHWNVKRRMSLKIKVLRDETVMGFKEFSIQKPRERQWPYNFVFENVSNKFNILSTESQLVKVFVNGEDWGVMLAEESIGKIYLENQQKLNSLIFKFGDAREWFEGWSNDPLMLYRRSDPSLIYKIYNQQKFLENDPQLSYRKKISYVLNLREKHINDLFNQDEMAMSYLLSTIWGNYHNLLNNNTAYYLNPYTLKLDPIIRDQYGFEAISSKEHIQQWPPPYQFLMSFKNFDINDLTKFENNFKKEIPFIDKKFLDAKMMFPVDMLKKIDILEENLQIFSNKNEDFLNFNSDQYFQILPSGALLDKYQLESLKTFEDNNYSISQNQLSRFTDLVYVRHFTNGKIKIFNLVPDEIEIEKIEVNGKNILINPVKLPNYLISAMPFVIDTDFTGIYDNKITVLSNYKNIQHQASNDLSLIYNVDNPFNPTHIPDFFKKYENEWVIASGSWNISKRIYIKGRVKIEEGTQLNFAEGSSLIIEGSLAALGSQERKIILNGSKGSWRGIYVLNSQVQSTLKNVIFKNTTGISDGILNLTGGVVFYNSNVFMENVNFENTLAEDALNIINSEYYLKNLSFVSSRSDAFDSDYSHGVIDTISFRDIGGDALDFSGSNVKVENFFADGVRDKAISVGEASNININNISVKNIGVAIASKDGSKTFASNCYVEDFQLSAFMTYIKKNNYSSPSLELKSCLTQEEASQQTFFRQKGTELVADNYKNIYEQDLNVDLLYQTEVMKK